MQLRDISMDDLALYEALLTDPATMSELGGPLPRQVLADKLQGVVAEVQAGAVWYSAIVPDDHEAPVGTVCIWDHDQDGGTISEIGWMVLPSFQGRGLASGAVRSILDRARAERRWEVIHAFPGVTNGPSNAICRKSGFVQVGEGDIGGREIEYMGRTLRCNHWVLDLRAGT
jgi:RimJ/RimL family protein N-acetyltransferase